MQEICLGNAELVDAIGQVLRSARLAERIAGESLAKLETAEIAWVVRDLVFLQVSPDEECVYLDREALRGKAVVGLTAGLRRERLAEVIAYNVKMFLDLLGRGL